PPRPRAVRSRGTRASTSPTAVPGPAGAQPARPSTTDRSPGPTRRWAGSEEARGCGRPCLLLTGHPTASSPPVGGGSEEPGNRLGLPARAVAPRSAQVAGQALPDDRLGGGRAGPVVV